jgi:hypothetical protein
MNKQQIIDKYSDEIIDLVNSYDEIPTSDMQGIAQVIVSNIINQVLKTKGGDNNL